MTVGVTTEEVDFHAAGEDDLAAIAAVAQAVEQEVIPAPWTPAADFIADRQVRRHRAERADWLVRDDSGPVARAELLTRRGEENRHAAYLLVEVVPAARRRGLGRHLVDRAVERARADGREVLTSEAVPGSAGRELLERLGFAHEFDQVCNRLVVSEVDRTMLARWQQRAGERARGYELVVWEGPCPPELVDRFAGVLGVMNTAPHGQDFSVVATTPDQVQAWDQARLERGTPWWTAAIRHDESDELIGFTQIVFSGAEPRLGFQLGTAVDPAHRTLGLGRWLKAAMLDRVRAERSELEVLVTWNAGGNAAMVGINRQLGFREVQRFGQWRCPLADLRLPWLRSL